LLLKYAPLQTTGTLSIAVLGPNRRVGCHEATT
jgi:hypothetical protein